MFEKFKVAWYVRRLSASDTYTQRAAIAALSRTTAMASVTALITCLRNPSLIAEAADALRAIGNPLALPTLSTTLSELAHSKDVKHRQVKAVFEAAADLQPTRNERLSFYTDNLSSTDRRVRLLALEGLEALGATPDQIAVAALGALSANDENVRAQAASLLRRYPNPIAFAALVSALDDPCIAVSDHAACALADTRDERAVLPLLNRFRRFASVDVIQALMTLAPSEAADSFVALLDGPPQNANVTRALIEAVATLKERRAIESLQKLLADENYWLPSAWALARLGAGHFLTMAKGDLATTIRTRIRKLIELRAPSHASLVEQSHVEQAIESLERHGDFKVVIEGRKREEVVAWEEGDVPIMSVDTPPSSLTTMYPSEWVYIDDRSLAIEPREDVAAIVLR